MRKIYFIVIFFLTFTCVNGQVDDSIFIKKISDEILTNGTAYDNLHYLTKQIGGRLAGSPGMVKAEKWGLQIMQETGADKAWLQECMVPHWVRGGKDEAMHFLAIDPVREKSLYACLGQFYRFG